MPDREQPRDAVERGSEVVALALIGRTGMNGGTYAQSIDPRKILRIQSALRIEYRCNGVLGAREGRTECIADGLKNVAIVVGDRRLHQRIVPAQSILHRLPVALPALSASFDIGKQKRDRAGRARGR